MTKFFNKSKKPYFWPIFPIFATKIPSLSLTTAHGGLLHDVELQKKLMNQSQENFRTEKRKDGRTDHNS